MHVTYETVEKPSNHNFLSCKWLILFNPKARKTAKLGFFDNLYGNRNLLTAVVDRESADSSRRNDAHFSRWGRNQNQLGDLRLFFRPETTSGCDLPARVGCKWWLCGLHDRSNIFYPFPRFNMPSTSLIPYIEIYLDGV